MRDHDELDKSSPEEIARRRDAGLLRALKTLPKPHKEMVGKARRSAATAAPPQSSSPAPVMRVGLFDFTPLAAALWSRWSGFTFDERGFLA
jgi:hypothetical protein